LDSTDDFAIYSDGIAISVHQVKAKASHYRSAFEKALNKSSKICIDCCPNTKDTSISLMKLMILVIMKMRKKQ
jgi:hypothetical protein